MPKPPAKIEIMIATVDGKMPYPAYKTEVPGLVLTRQPNMDGTESEGGWNVTHEPSGTCVTRPGMWLPTRKRAMICVKQLGAYGIDWTEPDTTKAAARAHEAIGPDDLAMILIGRQVEKEVSNE